MAAPRSRALNFVRALRALTFTMGGHSPFVSSHPSRAIRALVVGAGETSVLIHLPVLARLRDCGRLALVEICDVRQERAAAAQERFGFARSGGDARSALQRPEIEAVYLFGDARMHHDIGLAALECGKHLFVEKPIAPSYAQACEMAEAARSRGLIAAGGHNRRFSLSLGEVRRRGAKAGWRYAEAVFHKPALGLSPPFGASSWLTANGIHALDALVFVMGGPPEQLTAVADAESYTALMRWADGAQGVFLCNNHAGERREAYAFHAPGETCRVDDSGLRIAPGGAIDIPPRAPFQDGFEGEHAAFLDGVEQGAEPPNGLSILAPSLKLAELIEAGFSGRMDWPRRPAVPRGRETAGPRRRIDADRQRRRPDGHARRPPARPAARRTGRRPEVGSPSPRHRGGAARDRPFGRDGGAARQAAQPADRRPRRSVLRKTSTGPSPGARRRARQRRRRLCRQCRRVRLRPCGSGRRRAFASDRIMRRGGLGDHAAASWLEARGPPGGPGASPRPGQCGPGAGAAEDLARDETAPRRRRQSCVPRAGPAGRNGRPDRLGGRTRKPSRHAFWRQARASPSFPSTLPPKRFAERASRRSRSARRWRRTSSRCIAALQLRPRHFLDRPSWRG